MTLTNRDWRILALALAFCSPGVARAAETVPEERRMPLLVPHTKFSQDCGQCHIAKRWDVIKSDFHFDHGKETGFPLNGAHANAKCVQCHTDRGPVSVYAARGCGGCHPDPHRSTMGLDCQRCHTEITWTPKNSLAEHARTAFPLTGAHVAVECQRCHVRAAVGDFRGTSLLCYSCHQLDFQRGANHIRFNYPRTCGDCHNTSSFSGARFNHGFLSNVADCYVCHIVDYQRADRHVAFNYPRTCGDCHNTTSFTAATFTHMFLGAAPVCYSCHAADYQRTPDHVAKNFPKTCADCHLTSTWLTKPAASLRRHP